MRPSLVLPGPGMHAGGKPLMDSDRLLRGLCGDLRLRVYAAMTLHTAREIASIHGTSPNATVALSRTVTAAALLSATLKARSHQSISVKFSGSGPIREVYVQADATGAIRGYAANPVPDLTDPSDRISFSHTIGAGLLTVMKDLGLREPYKSVTPLLRGEVAEDIAYYLTVSEQVPSALIIAATLDREGALETSGGILIQTLPDTPPEAIERVEAAISSMKTTLGAHLASGGDIAGYAGIITAPDTIEILEESPLAAACRCSRDVVATSLTVLSAEELADMRDRDRGAEVICAFCKKVYRLDEKELSELIGKKKSAAGEP